MITFSKLVYDTLEILKGNHIVDDVDLMERQIMFHWNTQRALWLRNEYNKPGRSIDPEIEQDLGCLELVTVDAAECCSVEVCCDALRTKIKIPSLLEFHDKPGITRVGLPNKLTIPFTFTNYNKAMYSISNKYASQQVYAFLLNGYMYLITKRQDIQMLDYINVRGVFEDPLELTKFQCGDKACFSLEDSYPIKSWMIPYIRAEVVNILSTGLQIPKDKANDASDKPTQQ